MDPVFDSVDSGRVGGYPVRLPGLWLWLSLIAALLAAAGSVAGLLASDSIYDQETLALADASAARDIVNLVLVAPLMAAIAASASVSDRLETPTGDDMRGEPDVEDPRAPHPWARPFVVIPDHGGAIRFPSIAPMSGRRRSGERRARSATWRRLVTTTEDRLSASKGTEAVSAVMSRFSQQMSESVGDRGALVSMDRRSRVDLTVSSRTVVARADEDRASIGVSPTANSPNRARQRRLVGNLGSEPCMRQQPSSHCRAVVGCFGPSSELFPSGRHLPSPGTWRSTSPSSAAPQSGPMPTETRWATTRSVQQALSSAAWPCTTSANKVGSSTPLPSQRGSASRPNASCPGATASYDDVHGRPSRYQPFTSGNDRG